ncbi:MAG: polyphosphate polymerase domain-containing protein [Clostridia bacterium]|nr:polyphosphate polymerase domain-containing protein [Clostridia bacterium]
MGFQTVFKRYELKYMLTPEQKERVLGAIAPYMALDHYGRTTIRNIYFDTESYRLIRRSIEKPIYKEKLRVRSYATATHGSTVFVELKKKYKKVVYKRRLPLTEGEAMTWLLGRAPCPVDTQISREIDYFREFYGDLRPAVFLSYEREAYYERGGGDFRLTFDDRILCRREEIDLTVPPGGEALLADGQVLMELKCSGGLPLWMVEILSREGIYKTSFSKYGTAYQRLILPARFPSNHTESKEKWINGSHLSRNF